jgi:hypothetical protein
MDNGKKNSSKKLAHTPSKDERQDASKSTRKQSNSGESSGGSRQGNAGQEGGAVEPVGNR